MQPQPFKHALALGIASRIHPTAPHNREHGMSNGAPFGPGKRWIQQQRRHQMERRRQLRCLHNAAAPLSIYKEELVIKGDFIPGSDTAIKIAEVGAATKRHMLAIINVLATRQNVRSCPAAQKRALFKHGYTETGFSQHDGRGKPRQPAADYDHALRGHLPPTTTPDGRAKE